METEIIITNVLPTGTSFAVRADDMSEGVFIPAKAAQDANLRPAMRVMASLVPNPTNADKTPWRAIALHQDAWRPLEIKIVAKTLADRIREELANGPATTIELARFLKVNSSDVMQAVREMNLPSTELWALEMADLMEAEE
jgi:hypothetical protein